MNRGADIVLYASPLELQPSVRERRVRANPARKSRVHEAVPTLSGSTERLLVRTALIRSSTWDPDKIPSVTSSRSVQALLAHAVHFDQEYLFVIAVDSQGRAVAVHETAVGHTSAVSQQLSHVVKVPFLVGVRRAIVAHNHPSGSPQPSADDVTFTRGVASAFACLEMQLMDHVIIARDGYYSFLDEGRLPGR